MPDLLEEFARKTIDDLLKTLPVEKRLEGISAEELLAVISREGLLKSIPVDQLLAALPPETRAALIQKARSNGSQPNPEG